MNYYGHYSVCGIIFFFCKAKLSSVEIVIGIFLPMTLWYDMRKEQMFWQLMWTFGKISWLLSPVVSSWNLLWWHSKNVDLCLGPSMITVVDWRLKTNYFKKQSYSSLFGFGGIQQLRGPIFHIVVVQKVIYVMFLFGPCKSTRYFFY